MTVPDDSFWARLPVVPDYNVAIYFVAGRKLVSIVYLWCTARANTDPERQNEHSGVLKRE